MEFAIWIIVWAIIGFAFGAAKGRFVECVMCCILLGPIGLLICVGMKSQKELDRKKTKKCPNCAERILKAAKLCKHCGRSVDVIQQVPCPHCNRVVFGQNFLAGSAYTCPHCSGGFMMPG